MDASDRQHVNASYRRVSASDSDFVLLSVLILRLSFSVFWRPFQPPHEHLHGQWRCPVINAVAGGGPIYEARAFTLKSPVDLNGCIASDASDASMIAHFSMEIAVDAQVPVARDTPR